MFDTVKPCLQSTAVGIELGPLANESRLRHGQTATLAMKGVAIMSCALTPALSLARSSVNYKRNVTPGGGRVFICLPVLSLWPSGTAVEVRTAGPVSSPTVNYDEGNI